MKLNEFQEANAFLSAATLADPFLALCSVTAWLDPLAKDRDDLIEQGFHNWDDIGDDWTNIGFAWDISRNCFPEVYVETTLALRHIPDSRRLAEQVCTAINGHLIGGELHDLEQIHFGLPFFGMGIDVADAEFFAAPQYTPLVDVYAMLDVRIDPQTYTVPDGMYESAQTADVLAYSLRQTQDSTHEKLAWLLDWAFSQTGNTASDYTDEDMYEMGIQPLEWNPNELEFNNLMYEEAVEIIGDAMQGLDLLMGDEALQTELRANFDAITKLIQKEKTHDRYQPDAERLSRSIRWADRPERSDEDQSADDLESVPIRGADAA